MSEVKRERADEPRGRPRRKASARRWVAHRAPTAVAGADPRRRCLRAAFERHHQPRRQHRLQDGRRRDPASVEPARDRHRHLEVLPQGGPSRRQGARARPACARSSTASRTTIRAARRGASAATSPRERTPTHSRPSSPTCWSTSTAPSIRRSGSTAAFGTSTGSTVPAETSRGTSTPTPVD